jgi:hypothetical protein
VLQHLFERHGVVVEVAIFVILESMEHKRLKVAVLENGISIHGSAVKVQLDSLLLW